MRAIALALMALCAGAEARAAEPAIGTWAGKWSRAGDDLEVVLQVRATDTPGQYRVSFSSDRLRVADIPFASARGDGCCGIRMELRGDETTTRFTGRVEGGEMSGTFVEGESTTGTFKLHRVREPQPGARSEPARFANGDVNLAGTLELPGSPPPHPAVVMVHGSGAEGRWASRYLARRFARAGIAALAFDKRGVGESSGDWRRASFDDLAHDVAAAVAWLRARPDIDRARVGLHGHSQGATILPLVAKAAAPVAFMVASASSGVSMEASERFSVGNAVGERNLPPGERALAARYIEALVAVAYRGEPHAALDEAAREAAGHSWFFTPPQRDNWWWAFSRQVASYDPPAYWAEVKAPVLLLYGSADERVPVEPSIRAIRAALARSGHAPPTVCVYPGADHTERQREPRDAWPRNAPGYLDDLMRWIGEAARRGGRPGPEGLSKACH